MMFPERPKSEETEEDLLRFQQQFLKSARKPAAKAIRLHKPSQQDANIPVESNETDEKTLSKDVETESDKQDTHIVSVVGDIRERNTNHGSVMFPAKRSTSFPTVFQRIDGDKMDKKLVSSSSASRKSIFGQQIQDKSLSGILPSPRQDSVIVATSSLSPLAAGLSRDLLEHAFFTSKVITGSGLSPSTGIRSTEEERKKIHEESLQRLSAMTETDIIHEKEKLLREMDPKLVNFLQNKRLQNQPKKEALHGELPLKSRMQSLETQEKIKDNGTGKNSGSQPSPGDTDKIMHMDTVEADKLAWTDTLPQRDRKKISLSHRFNFTGDILSDDSDIPVHLGLHHHGEEPEMAGYSLDEIFILSRSNFTQHRVFALDMLGKIVTKAKHGDYAGVTAEPILSTLIDSGLLFLLRWSLDDQSENMIQSSVFAVHSLLCQSQDFLDTVFLRTRGTEVPALSPGIVKPKSDESDDELLKRDVILGFVRMGIIERLRYVMEVCLPASLTTNRCLDILLRICQHSTQCCVRVYECPRLVSFLINSLPMNSTSSSTDGPGKVGPKVVRLLRTMCTGGRHVTSRLLKDYPHMSNLIMQCAAGDLGQEPGGLVRSEMEFELWRLWIVCVSYGLLLEMFREMYALILRHIQTFATMLSTENFGDDEIIHAKKCQLVFLLCTKVMLSSSTSWALWEELPSLIQSIVKGCLQTTEYNQGHTEVDLVVSTGIQFLSAYCDIYSQNKDFDVAQACSTAEFIAKDILLPAFERLRHFRVANQSKVELGEQLASLPRRRLPVDISNLLYFQSFESVLQCGVSVCRLNRDCCSTLSCFIEELSTSCMWMLSDFQDSSFLSLSKLYSSYWATQLYIVVVTHNPEVGVHSAFFHRAAFHCLGRLGHGEEYALNHILSSVLFHPALISGKEAEPDTEANILLQKVLSDDDNHEMDSLDDTALTCVPAIKVMYLKGFFCDPKVLEQSKSRCLCKANSVEKLLLPPDSGPLLPSDWPFIPLVHFYNHSNAETAETPAGYGSNILHCLYYLCLLESHHPSCMSDIGVTTKVVRLMCLFLATNNLFLETKVKRCLWFFFRHYCKGAKKGTMDFLKPIPGVSSFQDFYVSLLEHYTAVSYGDPLFTSVILLPLHRSGGNVMDLRKALWRDSQEVLRIMRLTFNVLVLPLSWYLFPIERDAFLIHSYVSALAREHCCHERSPVMYLIAVHHTSNFLFNAEVSISLEVRREVYRAVLMIRRREVQRHILHYVSPDHQSALGFSFSEHATTERNQLISVLKGSA